MFGRLGLAREGCSWPRLVCVQPGRDLASDRLQNPLQVNGPTRWLCDPLAGPRSVVELLQLRDSRGHGFGRTISKMGKHAAGDDTENHLELEQLAGGRQSTAVFETADLAMASIAEQKSQVFLA